MGTLRAGLVFRHASWTRMPLRTLSWYTSHGSGLRIRLLKETQQVSWRGNDPVEESQVVRVEYTARAVNAAADAHGGDDAGAVVESREVSFRCGSGRVMAALDRGVIGMRVGDVRRIRAPHTLAYGREGKPPHLQPFSEVIFDVTLTGAVHHLHIEVLDRTDSSSQDDALSEVVGNAFKSLSRWLGDRGRGRSG